MSVAAQARPSNRAKSRGGLMRDLYFWGVSCTWIAALAWIVGSNWNETLGEWKLIPWAALIAAANLMPIPGWASTRLAPDAPIAVAAALSLTPSDTAVVAFVGGLDMKEFRGEISISKALFNRSQLSLNYSLGAWVVRLIAPHPSSSNLLLVLAVIAFATQAFANYALVATAVSIDKGVSLPRVLGRLRLGAPVDFVIVGAASIALGAMLGALYWRLGALALACFVAPMLLGRQALLRSQMFIDANAAYHSRERVWTHLSRRIHEERTDERRLIAADLHDEVLQPLFKVTLMAQVLKADIATGRLLELDQDVPELMNAANLASETLRELIGDLRRSQLGSDGLGSALKALIRTIEKQATSNIQERIGTTHASPELELVVYQVAKEALSNSLTHARAAVVTIEVGETPTGIRLKVEDDGIGFDPMLGRSGHFGLDIMRERTLAVGGTLYLDSVPGEGCRITALFPDGRV